MGCVGDRISYLISATTLFSTIHITATGLTVTFCSTVKLWEVNFFTLLSFYYLSELKSSHFSSRKCKKKCRLAQLSDRSIEIFKCFIPVSWSASQRLHQACCAFNFLSIFPPLLYLEAFCWKFAANSGDLFTFMHLQWHAVCGHVCFCHKLWEE